MTDTRDILLRAMLDIIDLNGTFANVCFPFEFSDEMIPQAVTSKVDATENKFAMIPSNSLNI